jgi:hypothetical protein
MNARLGQQGHVFHGNQYVKLGTSFGRNLRAKIRANPKLRSPFRRKS